MKIELLQKVLEAETGVRCEAPGAYAVGDEVELTLMIDMGHEPMSIPKVRKLSLQNDLLTVETHKGDRIYVSAAAAVRALKFSPVDANKSRGTGFTALRS